MEIDLSKLRKVLAQHVSTEFYIFKITEEDYSIKEYIVYQGLEFKSGNAYYEMYREENISKSKKMIVLDEDYEIYIDDNARDYLGIYKNEDIKYNPVIDVKHKIFVQSKSSNRKLPKDSNLLYILYKT
jgi:hypothetical protein